MATSERPDEKAIFNIARQIGAPAVRAEYLRQACEGNDNLLERVRVLLQAFEEQASFLESPPAGGVPLTLDFPSPQSSGTQIGAYKLLQQIGEGGMGAVYMAEQMHPVQRKVALKLIKAGLDNRQVIARFEAERQALALMDHPNIAKVLDAGTTDAGQPYFVMELVHGVPITKYCDDHRLTPRQRLELFVPVCQAIQHAHQKGIIHRDIKPSNVLVALYDGKPLPKVIDFGVAKATGPKLTDKTMFTEFGSIVGTLEYMSPEQAERDQYDIDTRSDIYSLGVLLYELLTGTTPLDRKRFKSAAILELLRVIKEDEPQKPSTRLSTTDELPSIAANRNLEPKKLSGLVRGELDWIVMKALEKDRNRRYETANGFAMDVLRYLADEPVTACPPSVAYRLRKFVRRNKVGIVVAGLVLFFVVLLGSGAGWAIRDRQARALDAAKERAARITRLEEQVTRALTESQEWLDQERLPEAIAAVARAESLLASGETGAVYASKVGEARAGVDLVEELDDIRYGLQPSTGTEQFDFSMESHRRYEVVFARLGIDVDAVTTRETAERIVAHPLRLHLVAALDGWADRRHNIVLKEKQRGDAWWHRPMLVAQQADDDAVRNRVRTAVIQHDLRALDDLCASPDVSNLPVPTAGQLARALYWTNTPERKEAALTALKAVRARHPDHFGLNIFLHNYLQGMQRHEEALSYLRAAEALRPQSSTVQYKLGVTLDALGRPNEVIAAFRHAIDLDPKFVNAQIWLGVALSRQGQIDDALACYRKALELDPRHANAHVNLGVALAAKGQLDEATACFQKAIDLDPTYATAHYNLGRVLRDQGKLDEAIACYRKSLDLNPNYAPAWRSRGLCLASRHQWDRALADYAKAVELDPQNAFAHNNIAWLLATCPDVTLRDVSRAVESANRAVELASAPGTAWNTLGVARYRAGDWQKAIDALNKSDELLKGESFSSNGFFLAMACWQLDQKNEAREWFHKSIAWMDANAPDDEELRRFRTEATELLGAFESTGEPLSAIRPDNAPQ